MSDILRDFKTGLAYQFTASKIIKAIENNTKESRKKWLQWLLMKEDKIWLWEEGYQVEEIFSNDFFKTKSTGVTSDDIHMNPVRAGIVEKEEEYLNSSCADYYGIRKGKIDLHFRFEDWKSSLTSFDIVKMSKSHSKKLKEHLGKIQSEIEKKAE